LCTVRQDGFGPVLAYRWATDLPSLPCLRLGAIVPPLEPLTAFPPFLTLHLGKQLGEAHVQRLRNPVEVDDADVALASLNPAHVGPVQPRLLGERLLAVAPRVAQAAAGSCGRASGVRCRA
jgi:hypothetical protein